MKALRFFLISVIIATILFIAFILRQPISKQGIEREFDKNKTDIALVTKFLADSGCDSVYIPDFDESGLILAGLDNGDIPVNNTEVTAAIDRLMNRYGYEVICKREGAVYFQIWSKMEIKIGVVYSIDGQMPDETSFDFLVNIKPLTEPNWYYYEEDFNEWERIHSKQNSN